MQQQQREDRLPPKDRLSHQEQSFILETHRSKLNIDSLKRQVNHFLAFLQQPPPAPEHPTFDNNDSLISLQAVSSHSSTTHNNNHNSNSNDDDSRQQYDDQEGRRSISMLEDNDNKNNKYNNDSPHSQQQSEAQSLKNSLQSPHSILSQQPPKTLSVIYSTSQHQQDSQPPTPYVHTHARQSLCTTTTTTNNMMLATATTNVNRNVSCCQAEISPQLVEGVLAQLHRYKELPGIALAVRQIEAAFDALGSQRELLRARVKYQNDQILRLKQQAQLRAEAVEVVRGQWQNLLRNNEQLVKQNFGLAERLEIQLGQSSRTAQLEKQIEYMRFLIVTANERYEQVRQDSEQKGQLLKCLLARQKEPENEEVLREFQNRVRNSQDPELEMLIKGFLTDGGSEDDSFRKSTTFGGKQKQKEKENGSKKQRKAVTAEGDSTSIEQSFRKKLFRR